VGGPGWSRPESGREPAKELAVGCHEDRVSFLRHREIRSVVKGNAMVLSEDDDPLDQLTAQGHFPEAEIAEGGESLGGVCRTFEAEDVSYLVKPERRYRKADLPPLPAFQEATGRGMAGLVLCVQDPLQDDRGVRHDGRR
jgi:hypothetical protein